MKALLASICAGLMLWGGSANAACTLGAVAVLPLQIQQGQFVFAASINDKPANFALDTGAFATTLTLTAAERLGVRMDALGADMRGVGGVRHLYRGTASHMRMGQMSADGMILAGADILDAQSTAGVDGLFGMNMMSAYDIDLDVAGHHAILYEADGSCSKPTVALAQPLYMVRLEYIQHDQAADVEITIDGHRLRAIIDSGAAHTVMFASTARRLGLDLSALHAPDAGRGYGIGPFAVPVMRHVFDAVQIGDLQIRNMPIAILAQANMGFDMVHTGSLLADPSSGQPGGEDMLLGADFMQKVHLWISHSSQTLIMQYPPQPSVLPH